MGNEEHLSEARYCLTVGTSSLRLGWVMARLGEQFPEGRVEKHRVHDTSTPGPGEGTNVQGTLVELFLAIPYLMSAEIIPPLNVLNELFAEGVFDAGMSGGCRWEAFEIGVEEYQELVEGLLKLPGKNYEFVEPPSGARTLLAWTTWRFSYRKRKSK